ncbi:MAG: hypothetical protein R3F49_13495 [Planctomycetota bacterium]
MKRTLPTCALIAPVALVLALLPALSCANVRPPTATHERQVTWQDSQSSRTATQTVHTHGGSSLKKPEVDTGGFLIYQPDKGSEDLLVGFAFAEKYSLTMLDARGQRMGDGLTQYHVDLWVATDRAADDLKAPDGAKLFKVLRRPGSTPPDLPIFYKSVEVKSDGTKLNRREFRDLVKRDYGLDSANWPDHRSTELFELWKVTEDLQPKE